jgi:ABC-type nitrate/sulfonate/bicarbonate transport system permease component
LEKLAVKEPGLPVRASSWELRVLPAPHTRWLIGAGAVGLIVVLWFLATLGRIPEQRLISPVILPSPLEVARSFGPLWTERGLLDSIIATLRRVLLGFGLAILIGVRSELPRVPGGRWKPP